MHRKLHAEDLRRNIQTFQYGRTPWQNTSNSDIRNILGASTRHFAISKGSKKTEKVGNSRGIFENRLSVPARYKGPFINYGSGGTGGKLGGGASKKNHNKEGELPKLFSLMRGGLVKNKLVSSDYPCQRNKHCRIPCTHVNLDHWKCEV